jgi:putative transposase
MARMPRDLVVHEGSTNHCTWRSNANALVLDTNEARRKFLSLLRKYKDDFGIEIYSYTLMGTHPHVVVHASRGQPAFSEFWKRVNWGFARWYNLRTQGRGTVVMERMRSPRIQDGRHQLTVMRYGDLNPVRAGLVRTPGAWTWSSFRHYAYGERDDLITDAPEYAALGRTAPERRRLYLHLFARKLTADLLERRADLVDRPFIGDARWVAARLVTCRRAAPD